MCEPPDALPGGGEHMTPPPNPAPDLPDRHALSELASGAIDGKLSAAQQAQLESALRDSAEARAFYVRFMGMSAELAYAGRGATVVMAEKRPMVRRNWYPLAAAAAIVLLAMLGVALLMQKPVDVAPAGFWLGGDLGGGGAGGGGG